MTRTCNFPVSQDKRCKQPIADGRPNCGRHSTELSADQLGQSPIVYRKDGELHAWAGDPDGLYCLIHSDPVYQVLYQVAGEKQPSCLEYDIRRMDGHGRLHRDDGPAWIRLDGTREWWQSNKRHRDDGPAIARPNGVEEWYQHGERHRDNGPALTWPDGVEEWYQRGNLHRDDGPAVIKPDGTQGWYQYDKLHRDDKPAWIQSDGTQLWYQHGERHRDDGPAVIWADGTQEWYWHGKAVTEEEHAKLRKQSRGV